MSMKTLGWVLGAAGVLLAAGCESGKQPAAAAAGGGMPPAPVVVAKAATGDVPVVLHAVGTVLPVRSVTVAPQVSGLLTKVNVKDGDDVKEGQVLFEIDPRVYQAALDKALASTKFTRLLHAGYGLAANGTTSLEEVERTVGR